MSLTVTRVRRRISRLVRARTQYQLIFRKYRAFTMCTRQGYVATLELVDRYAHVSGAIVECGTWRGGMIAGMADLLGRCRTYHLFDSFQGLPPATELDGPKALAWQADVRGPKYFNNCRAAEDEARAAMRLADTPATFHTGWFRDTLPGIGDSETIAILRLDADWYESTTQILQHLFSRVSAGGLVIVDDYYTWDGCAKAVHDFLSANQRTERIRTYKGVCYIEKH